MKKPPTTTPPAEPFGQPPPPPESADQLPARRARKPNVKVAQLTLTSFMDVVFNLLMFFVLTAAFPSGEGVLPATLPAGTGSGAASLEPPPNTITITLRSVGRDQVVIQIEEAQTAPANFEQLFEQLRAWRRDPVSNRNGLYAPDNPIMIKPDRETGWSHVVEAFNAVIRAQFTNVGFAPAS